MFNVQVSIENICDVNYSDLVLPSDAEVAAGHEKRMCCCSRSLFLFIFIFLSSYTISTGRANVIGAIKQLQDLDIGQNSATDPTTATASDQDNSTGSQEVEKVFLNFFNPNQTLRFLTSNY